MRAALVAVACLALSGCGPGPSPMKAAAPKPEKDARRLRTGPVEVVVKDDEGRVSWTMQAEDSRLVIPDSGAMTSMAEAVTGAVYEAGKVSSRYTAEAGTADQGKKTAVLTGAVEVTHESTGRVLRAARVVYSEARRRFEASGSVTVSSGEVRIGPFAQLYATPDLKRVGTPDRFR